MRELIGALRPALGMGQRTGRAAMTYDEYRRLHLACLDMARQTSLPDVRARWLAMADAWLKAAIDLRESSVTAQARAAAASRLH